MSHCKSGVTETKALPTERTNFISLLIVLVPSNSYECGKPSALKMQSWNVHNMNFCNPSVKQIKLLCWWHHRGVHQCTEEGCVTNEMGGMDKAKAVEPHALVVMQLVPALRAARCSSRSVAILLVVSTWAWLGQVVLT